MISNSRLRLLLAAAAACGTSGCTEDIEVLQAYASEVNGRSPPPLEPLPVMMNFPIFIYDKETLRDPFLSGEVLSAPGVPVADKDDPDAPDLVRIKEQLETLPLDSLDMVGTMGQGKAYFGLVKDPDGVVHRVQINNYLGQNYGLISSISEDRIELEERIEDGNGGWERRSQSIALDDNNPN